jgi:hypothetical protein
MRKFVGHFQKKTMKTKLQKIVRVRLSEEIIDKIPAKNLSAYIRLAVLEKLQENEEFKVVVPF